MPTATPSKRLRLSITVTPLMSIALSDLASRNGLADSTQATMLLRQALDRTMSSAVVQNRYRQHVAQRTARTWQEDTVTEHAIETEYQKEQQTNRSYPAPVAAHKQEGN